MRLEYVIEESVLIRDYLKNKLRLSSASIRKLKNEPLGITVNGIHRSVRYMLTSGDRLVLHMKDVPNENVHATKLEYEIIYEDDDILVVNKPCNMPVHPSQSNFENTLANAVKYDYEKRGEHFLFRPINRIDKDTSGLVLIAKNAISANMNREIASGQLKRRYIGIVKGELDEKSGTIDLPIDRDSESIIKRCVKNIGKRAITHYNVVESVNDISLVQFMLETGRTHQIRVHMSYIGHPILSDFLYGTMDNRIARQALHCEYMHIVHPITHKKMEFFAKLPSDMINVLENERGRGKI